MNELLKILKEAVIRFSGSLTAMGLSYVLLAVITRYLAAPVALIILAAGYFVKSSFGPEGMTLEAFGNTRLCMFDSLIWLGSNVGLSCLLIPGYGIVGAALASSASLILAGAAGLVQIYVLHHLQPYNLHYLKYLAVGLAPRGISYALSASLLGSGIGALLLLLPVLAAIYVAGLYYSRSLDSTDYEVLERIRAKIADARGTE